MEIAFYHGFLMLHIYSIYQGWPDFFSCGPNLKIIFRLGPHFSKFLRIKFFFDLFNAYWEELCTFFVQNCLSRLKLFAFHSNKKGPRAAKNNLEGRSLAMSAIYPAFKLFSYEIWTEIPNKTVRFPLFGRGQLLLNINTTLYSYFFT